MNFLNTIKHIFKKPEPIPVKRKYVKRVPVERYSVYNDTSERIASLRFTVPALRVGVLDYTPEELKIKGSGLEGKTVHLYYPPEEVSAKKFLKTLETAPVIVGVGHGKTTNEKNKDIDGWPSSARYDEQQKAAIIDGVVKGKDEVDYINENLNTKDFGASAFIDFIAKIESGVTPDGQEYNAIAQDLKVTHVALTGSVRDPLNKIQVRNTVAVVNSVTITVEGNNKTNEEKKTVMEMTTEQIGLIVKNAIKEELESRNAEDEIKELKNKIKNMEEEREKEKAEAKDCGGKSKNAEEEKEEKEEKEKEKKAEEGKEDTTLENAKPSQALIAAVGNAYNIDFGTKTPSFVTLANIFGIKEAEPAARIIAVNAKFSEITAGNPVNVNNTKTSVVGVF